MMGAMLLALALLGLRSLFPAGGTAAAAWTTLYAASLTVLALLMVRPYSDDVRRHSVTHKGKLLVGVLIAALGVAAYLYHPGSNPGFRESQPTLWAVSGVGVMLALLVALAVVLRMSTRVERLRVISAAAGGGFLIRFPNDAAVAAAVESLPGAKPTQKKGVWSVPASAEAAKALLAFSKLYRFDFEPQSKARANGG